MRYPLDQVRRDTRLWCKCTKSFKNDSQCRKLPMTIARVMGAVSASYQVALPVLPRQCHVIRACCLDTKYGGK